jgi:hypothetical protein
MMCEDPRLYSSMTLPWPGVGPTPDEVKANNAKFGKTDPIPTEPKEPTEASDCFNLHQSIGWWEGVHKLGAGWGPGERNIVLSLNVDGFQPFKRGGVSIAPLSLMVLNLPENLRHHADNMILAGIIPRKEPKNQNTYLRLLVDELKSLYKDGFTVTDPMTQLPTTIKVKLLFTACDYPAHCHMNYQHTKGRYGCHKCDIRVSM